MKGSGYGSAITSFIPSVENRPVSKRRGIFSALDSDLAFGQAYKELVKHGFRTEGDKVTQEAGVVMFQLVNPAGEALTGRRSMNWNGKTIWSDTKGKFRITDRSYLQKQYEEKKRNDKYLEDVLDLCSSSDYACRTILGLSVPDYNALMGSNPTSVPLGHAIFTNAEIDEDIVSTKCRIDYINTLPENKIGASISKLKFIIDHIRPAIEQPEGTADEEAFDDYDAVKDFNNNIKDKPLTTATSVALIAPKK